jgi:hypothetical protein
MKTFSAGTNNRASTADYFRCTPAYSSAVCLLPPAECEGVPSVYILGP